MLTIVKDYIKEKYNKPGEVYLGLVHRLDRPTGGVMVFARTSKAAGRLSEQIREGGVHKKYLAIVDGKMEHNKGTMVDYLQKNEKKNTSRVVDKNAKSAKLAELDYEVVKYNDEINISVNSFDSIKPNIISNACFLAAGDFKHSIIAFI